MAVLPPDDSVQVRCPRLGHQIHFSYCRQENFGLPCARTLTCWHVCFNVEEYLRRELAPSQFQEAFATPVQPKVLSLLELLEQAQQRKKKS